MKPLFDPIFSATVARVGRRDASTGQRDGHAEEPSVVIASLGLGSQVFCAMYGLRLRVLGGKIV